MFQGEASHLKRSEGPQDHAVWFHHFMQTDVGNKGNSDVLFSWAQNHCGQ